jgi:hypothetical protein
MRAKVPRHVVPPQAATSPIVGMIGFFVDLWISRHEVRCDCKQSLFPLEAVPAGTESTDSI